MLVVEGLGVRLGQVEALADVSFGLQAGEIVLVTGPSGCGKSTLARCLNGLIPHHSQATMAGQVRVDGVDTRDSDVPALAARVGVVAQHPDTQLFNLTVEDDVAFGPRQLGLDAEEVSRRVAWALAALQLQDLARRAPTELSAGEKQRLAIASALALQPRYLVLDEPTANLDHSAARALAQTLSRLAQEQGMGILVLEHRLGELSGPAARLLVMDRGRIVATGAPQALITAGDGPLHRLGIAGPTAEPEADWAKLMAPTAMPQPKGPPFLELRGVEAGYGRQAVLRGVDAALYRGEIAALVGPNGAGKSTLARIMAGLHRPWRGELRLGGLKRRPRPGSEVTLLMESPDEQLFAPTVAEEIAFGPRLRGLDATEACAEALQAAGLADLRARPPHTLSLGQRQRTVLAALLALRPELLILDEPTLGQDWGHLSRLMVLVRHLNERGMTVLMITHDARLVQRYARRILLLEQGRITADGVTAQQE